MNLLKKIENDGFKIRLSDTPGNVTISPADQLTLKYSGFIKLHKSEIIQELKAINDESQYRYAYRFEFVDDGAGTWITHHPPNQAERALSERFPDKRVQLLALIN